MTPLIFLKCFYNKLPDSLWSDVLELIKWNTNLLHYVYTLVMMRAFSSRNKTRADWVLCLWLATAFKSLIGYKAAQPRCKSVNPDPYRSCNQHSSPLANWIVSSCESGHLVKDWKLTCLRGFSDPIVSQPLCSAQTGYPPCCSSICRPLKRAYSYATHLWDDSGVCITDSEGV